MKTKIKLLSLVLGISLSGLLFTQCVKNEESDGVRAVRQGYAAKLAGDAEYQKALADKAKADAEYTRAKAQWDKDYYAALTELEKVKAELRKVEVELKKVTLEEKKAELEEKKADLDAKIQNHKNLLLKAQGEYEEQVLRNEASLIAAQKALAEAKAKLLTDDPNLTAYLELKEKLYDVVNGLYPQKTAKLVEKLGLQAELIELKYAVNSEKLALLQRDSLKKATDLEYAKKLLEKYESLDGLSVAALQEKADDAKIEWEKAIIAAQDLNVVKTEKSGELTVAVDAFNQANAELSTLKSKLTYSNSIQETIVDSLYNSTRLNYNGDANGSVYPAPLSNLVYSTTLSSSGAQTILNLATGRLAYLQSASTAYQPTGWGYSETPNYNYPTKKWLEDRIAHIENNLLPSVATEIADQKAIIATAQEKFDDGKTDWEAAKGAYLTAVTDFNAKTTALRNQLNIWQTVTDAINAGSTVTLSDAQKTAVFNAVKSYYVMRYNFDRRATNLTGSLGIPTTLTNLNDAAIFDRDIFFGYIADNAATYQWAINLLKPESNVRIDNNYEWYQYEGNAIPSGNAAINVIFNTGVLPSDATVYQRSKIGLYLYWSAVVYGANAISDVHYYLPYDKRPTEKAPNVPSYPSFTNYNSSLFYILDDAKNVLAELKANAANTFYVENYKSVLGIVNRSIAFYEGLKTKYEAKVVEIKAEIEAQQVVVDAKKEVRDAAQLAYDKASAEYSAATTYASTLYAIYEQLSNATTSTLGIIQAAIAAQEQKIEGLVESLIDAEEALRDYRANGDESDLIAKLVAEKEAKIAAIDAEIAALEVAIADIEAKMEELLKDNE
jgi:hypothetical protein